MDTNKLTILIKRVEKAKNKVVIHFCDELLPKFCEGIQKYLLDIGGSEFYFSGGCSHTIDATIKDREGQVIYFEENINNAWICYPENLNLGSKYIDFDAEMEYYLSLFSEMEKLIEVYYLDDVHELLPYFKVTVTPNKVSIDY